MRKPCKILETENGTISLYGNHHWKEIDYKIPEWNEDDVEPDLEACFWYKNQLYFLSEFMRTNEGDPFYELGFHGYRSDSYFSGILIKYSDCVEAVQVFQYIS